MGLFDFLKKKKPAETSPIISAPAEGQVDNQAVQAVKDAAETLGDTAQAVVEKVDAVVPGDVQGATSGAMDAVKDAAANVQDAAQNVVEKAVDAADVATDKIPGQADDRAVDAIKDKIQ